MAAVRYVVLIIQLWLLLIKNKNTEKKLKSRFCEIKRDFKYTSLSRANKSMY